MTATWTRRRFLATTGSAALGVVAGAAIGRAAGSQTERAAGSQAAPASGGAPHADTPSATLAAAAEDLRRLVVERALTVDDPWVLMHVVLALGRDVRRGTEPVLDYVIRTRLESVTRGAKQYPAFPIKVEAHPNHFLEIMYSVGVAPDRAFATPAGTVTRADLTAGAKALFSPAIQGDELSWTVSVLTADMPPDADRFANAEGASFTVSAIVEAAAQAAEAGYADTLAAMRGTKPYGRSPVQEYSCNGTHVIYGLLDALRHGYRANRLPERATLLLQAGIYRLDAETALIDRVIGQNGAPGARLNADAAKLQFVGHMLENLRFARVYGLYSPTSADQRAIDGAEQELAAIAHRLANGHDLDVLARQVPRAYGLVLGDSCHALRAAARDFS